jgi:hypothetical protein
MRIARLAGRASTVSFLLTGALVSCGGHSTKVTQTLRTCVDRWNQGNMVGWGPSPVNVDFRRPNGRERRSIQLPRVRQCIVAIDLGDGSWTCVLSTSGAYWCPPLKESTGPELKRNARLDRHGVLMLDQPPTGTHPTKPLRWHRYPLVDAYIQPWTAGGVLRPGLTFKREGHGRCQLEDSTVNSAVSCLTADLERYDACFPRRRGGRGGDIAACADGPGYTTFTRWRISGPIPDPPRLAPWRGIGDLSLGEPRARVLHEYRLGADKANRSEFDYRRPGGRVQVGFDRGRVSTIRFSTPYYRTNGGFGVGSRIPRGHVWHGFVWNSWNKDQPCNCWTKVGLGAKSLPATGKNFLKPWVFINIEDGRVASFYFAARYID